MAKSELEEALDYFTEKAKKCGMTLREYVKDYAPTREQLENLISIDNLKDIADDLRGKIPVDNFMEDLKRQEDEKLAKKEKFEREYPVIDEHAMNIEAYWNGADQSWPMRNTAILLDNSDLALLLLALHFYKAKMFTDDSRETYLKELNFDRIFKSVRDQIIEESDYEAIDYLGEYLSINTLDEKEIKENS